MLGLQKIDFFFTYFESIIYWEYTVKIYGKNWEDNIYEATAHSRDRAAINKFNLIYRII